jgi:acyl-CoA thioesterase-2
MPEVPTPEEGLDIVALMRANGNEEADALAKEWASLDARYVGNSRRGLADDPRRPSRARMWIRVQEGLGDDPHLHLAAFTYASDMSLLGATLAAHETSPSDIMMASLDHTIWFHRPFRADEWWLYDQHSPSAQGGRGLAFAEVYAQDGRLVASVAQEGLIRVRR